MSPLHAISIGQHELNESPQASCRLAGLQYRLGAHALCRFEVQVVNQRKLLLRKSVLARALTGSVEIDRRCADSRPKRQIILETGQ